jgi:hypothetical protein
MAKRRSTKPLPPSPVDRVVARFGNRIVGHGTALAGQLLANERNWRIHPGEQQEVMSGLLEQVGFVQSVIVNRRSDPAWKESRGVETLVDGHLRVQLALTRGEETEVPVVFVDLSPEEEATILATFDPVGSLAVTDREMRDGLVADMPDGLRELTDVLRSEKKSAKKTVSFEASSTFRLIVDCENETQRDSLLARLEGEGYACRTS